VADFLMVVISVADAGPGVPEDELAHIFEKHYRGSCQRSRVPGTGLGLAIAKYLVESQSGRIWAVSRPEGGAAFHFSLPPANGATA
jgi:signal transduction histidine kinase